MTHSDRIAALTLEADAADASADLAEARGMKISAQFHRTEAARMRAQIERVRGEMLTLGAREIDQHERECCATCLKIVESCVARASRTSETCPAILYELLRILTATQR